MTRRPLLPPGIVVRGERPYAYVDVSLTGEFGRAVRAAEIRMGYARRYARKRARLRLCRW